MKRKVLTTQSVLARVLVHTITTLDRFPHHCPRGITVATWHEVNHDGGGGNGRETLSFRSGCGVSGVNLGFAREDANFSRFGFGFHFCDVVSMSQAFFLDGVIPKDSIPNEEDEENTSTPPIIFNVAPLRVQIPPVSPHSLDDTVSASSQASPIRQSSSSSSTSPTLPATSPTPPVVPVPAPQMPTSSLPSPPSQTSSDQQPVIRPQ
nr:hypothetical protein Iba_chr09eCG11750 [Ipomoea batatas]